jgi:hypothetical protein
MDWSTNFSGFWVVVGYFVMYSIRSGNKTQDVFKSISGISGLIGGGFLMGGDGRFIGNVIYGCAAYISFAFIIALVAVFLSSDKWRRFLGFLSKVLLGEDLPTENK